MFSISHDHALVKIYGHYAVIQGNKTTFHRHLIRMISIIDQDGKERWAAYNFVRKAYDHFAPILLKIIQDAISHLPEPVSEPITSIANSEVDPELADSQETASAPPSQDNMIFKKPSLPPNKKRTLSNASTTESKLQREHDRLQGEHDRLQREHDQLRQEFMDQQKERDQQLERQRQEFMDQQKEQLERQRQEFMELLKEQRELTDSQISGKPLPQ